MAWDLRRGARQEAGAEDAGSANHDPPEIEQFIDSPSESGQLHKCEVPTQVF